MPRQQRYFSYLLAVLPALLILTGIACQRNGPGDKPVDILHIPEDEIVRIPVVVHILYSNPDFNISIDKINSQLQVLNEDFRKKNADIARTPSEFSGLIADAGISFFLASHDPAGNPTNGIIRKETTINGWDGHNPGNTIPVKDLKLFHTTSGGSDAWPTDRYLNIWVTEMSDRNGRIGLAGYASFPGADPSVDGVVIDPRAFGTTEPLAAAHQLGRTATHEIGHWLNLLHIFGDGSGCASSDLVDDTPPAATRYLGTPSYPQLSCGNSNMFMNFMDNVNDNAMYMFTKGQRERMRNTFAKGGGRHRLYTNLNAN